MLIESIARKEIAAKLARITPSAETQFRVARNRKSRKAERAFLIAFMSGSPCWFGWANEEQEIPSGRSQAGHEDQRGSVYDERDQQRGGTSTGELDEGQLD